MNQPWTVSELQLLQRNAHLGANVVALLTGRTVQAVIHAAKRHRVSLRRSGERRGKVLGEPRRGSWPREGLRRLRDEVIDGTTDPVLVESHLLLVASHRSGQPQQLCPACSARPVQRQRTGLCNTCHLRALAEAHRHAKAEGDAQRELWNERQRKHRAVTPPSTSNEMGE